MQNKKLKICLL